MTRPYSTALFDHHEAILAQPVGCFRCGAPTMLGMCDPCLTSALDETQRDDLQRLPELNQPADDRLAWAAYFYARAGIPVHPLTPRRKSPMTDNGYLDATTDLRQVQAWWRISV